MADGVFLYPGHGQIGDILMSQPGMNLRSVRDWRCLSQEDLASAAQVNVCTIREIEQQRAYPRPSTRRKIAAALGVQPWEIAWRESTNGRGR